MVDTFLLSGDGNMSAETQTSSLVLRVATLVGRVVIVFALVTAGVTVAALAWFRAHDQQLFVVPPGLTGSTLTAGDVLIVTPPTTSTLVPGAVISFHAPARPGAVTRKVVSVKNGTFIQTKGNDSQVPDPDLVPVENVIGVASATVPVFGHWLVLYPTGPGQALTLGVPLLLLAFEQASTMVRRRRRVLAPV